MEWDLLGPVCSLVWDVPPLFWDIPVPFLGYSPSCFRIFLSLFWDIPLPFFEYSPPYKWEQIPTCADAIPSPISMGFPPFFPNASPCSSPKPFPPLFYFRFFLCFASSASFLSFLSSKFPEKKKIKNNKTFLAGISRWHS